MIINSQLIISCFYVQDLNIVVTSLSLITQVDKGVVPLAGTCGETTTQGQTKTALC